MDFCFILQIGCSNHKTQEGNEAYLCPRCHNPNVFAVKETRCLQICCVDLIPLGSSHIWQCTICQYQQAPNNPPLQKAGQGGYPQQQQHFVQQPQYQQYPQQPQMQAQPQQPGYRV